MKGYSFTRVWFVICEQCNEDIGPAAIGDNPRTKAAAEELAREHEETWHGGQIERDCA